jgi:drug/metabolite transporter (DMT)-like permease
LGILRPGFAAIQPGGLLVLGASLISGFSVTLIKVLGRTESSITITSYLVVLMGPLTLLVRSGSGSGRPRIYLYGFGVVATLLQLIFTQGVKEVEVAIVAPIHFFRILWAAIIGYVFFAEVPDMFTWIGGTMIFSSVIYITNREWIRRAE